MPLSTFLPRRGAGLALLAGLLTAFAARAQAPANDDPCGAVTLTPQGSLCLTPTVSTNAGATTTPPNGYGNPGYSTQVNGCGVALNPKDVWFKFTTTATGLSSFGATLTVSGNPAGLLRLFSASSCAGPFTSIQCTGGTTNNTVAARLITGSLAPNTTYYVQVAGYGSDDAQGPFTVCLTDGPGAPVCDPPSAGSIVVTYPATLRPGQGQVAFTPGANNVPPYTVTVTGGGPARVATTTSSPFVMDGFMPGVAQTVTVTATCTTGGQVSGSNVTTTPIPNNALCGARELAVNTACRYTGGNLFNASGGGIAGCGLADQVSYKSLWYKFTTAASGPGSTQATVQLSSNTGANELRVWSGSPTCPGATYTSLTLLNCTVGSSGLSPAPLTLTTLSPATTYYVQVGLSRQGTSASDFSICVTAPGACSAPTLAVSNVTGTSAVVTATPLYNATAPTDYTVTYQATGGPVQTLSPNPTGPGFSLGGLTPNTAYTVTVTANCAAGGVASTATITFTTATNAPPCADPTNLTVSNLRGDGATVSFAAATGATSYVVTYQAAGGSVQTMSPNPTASPVVLSGLVVATPYTVVVRAVCAAGTGNPAVVNFTTTTTTQSTTAYDDCATALALPVNTTCTYTQMTTAGATASTGVPAPGCVNGPFYDVWGSLTVPANGIVQVTTAGVSGSVVTDTGLALYGGSCTTPTLLGCNDDYNGTLFSQVRLTGLTPGTTVYARVWRYNGSASNGGPLNVCATTDATLATVSSTLASQVSLYPNPTRGAFTVSVPAALSQQATTASLYNSLGQLVRTQPVPARPTGQEVPLDASQLPAGIYSLRLPTAAGVVVKRLVVE